MGEPWVGWAAAWAVSVAAAFGLGWFVGFAWTMTQAVRASKAFAEKVRRGEV